jgi:hypothetical protein
MNFLFSWLVVFMEAATLPGFAKDIPAFATGLLVVNSVGVVHPVNGRQIVVFQCRFVTGRGRPQARKG